MKNAALILLLFMCTILPCRSQDDDESVYSLRQSIRQIHNQTEDKESIETQDANAHVQSDENTGKTVARGIMDQSNTSAGNNFLPYVVTGSYYRYYPSRMGRLYLLQRLALKQAQKEAAQQANAANQFYMREANSEKTYTLQKQRSLEDSALGLEQQIVGPPDEDGTRIQPLGTNLYVRNYITPPRPIIELVATQKKLQQH